MPARPFECLRCEHRYTVPNYDPKQVVERACPECGSNSVRPESKRKAAAHGGS